MLEQETAVEAESPDVSGSDQSLAEIVNENWPNKGGATETATPATGSASTETGKGKEPAKTDEPPAPKPELLTAEQVGKLTLKDISNPSFDWAKVPPELTPLLKGWQGADTRASQLAKQRSAPERKQPTPQPTEAQPPAAADDPIDEQNRKIVANALKDMGIDPEVAASIVEDGIVSKGAMLAAESVPRYAQDQTFQDAVHQALASDEELVELAESKDPKRIAQALRIAATRVELNEMKTQVSSIDKRTKDLDAREAKVKEQEAEVEQLRTKYQRAKPTVAGGSPSGAPAKPGGPPSVNDIVDSIWPSGGARVG